MIRMLLAAALLCAISSCSAVPALARGHHGAAHRGHAHRHHVGHRHHAETHQRAALAYGAPSPSIAWTGNNLVSQARGYVGASARQIGVRSSLWCSAFVRKLTNASGVDDRAISWLNKPHVAAAIGTIAVMRHHVGVVTGFDASGNPIIISGNNAHRVREGAVPRSRVISFVSP